MHTLNSEQPFSTTAMPAKQVQQPGHVDSSSSSSTPGVPHEPPFMLTSPATAHAVGVVSSSAAGATTSGKSFLMERRGFLTEGHHTVVSSTATSAFSSSNGGAQQQHVVAGDSDDDSGTSPPTKGGHHPLIIPPQRVTLSLPELLGLFAVSFSYAFCFNTLNTIVIPKEIERLTVSRQSMWVGLVMATGAISQLSTPIVGAWSDRAGVRTPYLIYGTFITVLGIVLFVVTESFHEVLFLFAAHVTTTIGLSVQYSMVTALLNDYVNEEHTGKGSGAMAILAIVGSGAGYVMFAMNVPLTYTYCSYILASVVCLGITVICIPQQPMNSALGASPQVSADQRLLLPGPPATAAHAAHGGSFSHVSSGAVASGSGAAKDINSSAADGSGSGGGMPVSITAIAASATEQVVPALAAAAEVFSTAVVQAMEFESINHSQAPPTSSSRPLQVATSTVSVNSASRQNAKRPPAASTGALSLVPSTASRFVSWLDGFLAPLSMPSPTRYPDFFFACCGRALFNAGLAGQVYLVYYLRDVIGTPNPVQITSFVAVMALLGGVVGALPSGMISDRVGKKPVIYMSTSICVVTLIGFMMVRDVVLLHIVGFLYGVGNVAYLSVDYALGVQALPKKRGVPLDAAKDLGVFAMSATVGALFGQVLYGAILDQFAAVPVHGSPITSTRYTIGGFLVIYALGGLSFVLSGVSTSLVKSVK